MKLSAEQFAELSSSFNAEASPTKHERRRANRMNLHARVTIEPIVNGERQASLPVVVCDFSTRGVAFIDARASKIGTQFLLCLPRRAGGSVTMLCTVAHVQEVSPSAWRMGAEFTCVLQSADQNAGGEQAEMKRIRDSMLG